MSSKHIALACAQAYAVVLEGCEPPGISEPDYSAMVKDVKDRLDSGETIRGVSAGSTRAEIRSLFADIANEMIELL